MPRRKKTHKKFLADVKRVHGDKYSILGEYEGNKTKILVRHNCNKCGNYEWMITPDNLLQGNGCPVCGKYKSANKRRKTHEQFVKEINEKYNEEYTVLGKYINDSTKILIKHKCEKCNNYEYEVRPSNILQGQGCPKCGGTMKKSHEEFIQEMQNKYGDEYTIVGKYINAKTKIKVKHNCDRCNNYEWLIKPSDLLSGCGCPKCAGKIKKTTEEFKKEIYEKYGNEYIILGDYKSNKTKIKVRHNCNKCGNYEYEVEPNSILRGTGCPVCSNKKIVLGVNTIYDVTPWMIELGVSIEDAKKYSSHSGKKITVKCPDCGREKKMKISNIYTYKSIRCSCGDGRSYPEKFVINVLDQLGVNYEVEKMFEWNDNRRYDFYIPSIQCIIEAHGLQHYNGSFKKWVEEI